MRDVLKDRREQSEIGYYPFREEDYHAYQESVRSYWLAKHAYRGEREPVEGCHCAGMLGDYRRECGCDATCNCDCECNHVAWFFEPEPTEPRPPECHFCFATEGLDADGVCPADKCQRSRRGPNASVTPEHIFGMSD